jgi:hypothetical protein
VQLVRGLGCGGAPAPGEGLPDLFSPSDCGLLTPASLFFNGACIFLLCNGQPVYGGKRGNKETWPLVLISPPILISARELPTPPASDLLPIGLMWLLHTHIQASSWSRQKCKEPELCRLCWQRGCRAGHCSASWLLACVPDRGRGSERPHSLAAPVFYPGL